MAYAFRFTVLNERSIKLYHKNQELSRVYPRNFTLFVYLLRSGKCFHTQLLRLPPDRVL